MAALPEAIADLTALQSLDLQDNKLRNLPSGFSRPVFGSVVSHNLRLPLGSCSANDLQSCLIVPNSMSAT